MVRIEIVAIGEDKVYSVGVIEVSQKGDVYIIHKAGRSDFHTSRHASGEMHWKLQKDYIKIRDGIKIEDFKGIELLGTHSFGLDSLPASYKEYRMERCDGIFTFDMREYKESAFNLLIAMLTEEGLPNLYNSWKGFKKGQIYLYTDCHPMIGITIADAKESSKGE